MARPTFEACDSVIIPVRDLVTAVANGTAGLLYMTFRSRRDPAIFAIVATVNRQVESSVEFEHVERCANGQPVRYRVDLLATPQPFGGVRWWFRCPVTGGKATKLILPRGGARLASREAWNLGYQTQRAGRLELVSRRAARVYRAIGGTGNWRDGPPDKPRWMRWETYSKGVLALRALKAEHGAIWVSEVCRAFPSIKARVSRP